MARSRVIIAAAVGVLFGAVGLPWLASTFMTISQTRGPIGKVWRAPVPAHWPQDGEEWFFYGFSSIGGLVESHTVRALPDIRSDRFVSLTELRAGWPIPSLRSIHLAEVDDRGIVIYPMSAIVRTGIPIPGTPPVRASAVHDRTLPVLPIWGGMAVNALVWGLITVFATELMTAIAGRYRSESLAYRGLCPRCGYDLRGVATCPECGTPAAVSPARRDIPDAEP